MSEGYSFGEYVLDTPRRTLRRGERDIDIGARAFGVLQLLVENAGRVVSRHELLDGVWGDVVVSDDSLARAVSDLRTALGDDASQPRFIRTVHRHGYVLVTPVTRLHGVEPSPVTEEAGRWKRLRTPLIVATLAVLVVASVWALRRIAETSWRDADASPSDFSTWRLRALGPAHFTSTAIKPALAKSHDLLSVVAPDPDTGVHSIFLLRSDGGDPLQLTRNVEVRGPSPEFTADDSHIIFTSYHSDPDVGLAPDVWLAPIPAGEPVLLVANASAASSGPDGRGLVYSAVTADGTSIRVRHQDGREVAVADRGFWPRWSPDGEWIAYTTSDPEGGDGTLHVVRPDGSGHQQLTTIPSQMYGLCWTADSERVIFASEQAGPSALWSVNVEGGDPVAVTWGPGSSASPTMAHDGRRLVFHFDHRRWYLYLAPEAGGPMRRVLAEAGVVGAALSPEGERIALALGAEAQSPAVAVLDILTTEQRMISGMSASAVAWMPDGRDLLVAAAAPDAISHWIWRLPVGGGLPYPVMKGTRHWNAPSASPDGSMLAAVSRTATGSELVVRDLERGVDRVLAEHVSIVAPRWSPDSRIVTWSGAWRPDDLASGGVWVCPALGGTPRRLIADGAWPVWEADGEHILFVRFLEHEGIWRVPVAGGSPIRVHRLEGGMQELSLEGLDIGRAGSPLLVLLSKITGEIYALEAPDG